MMRPTIFHQLTYTTADGALGNLAEAPEQRLAEGCWPDRIIAEVNGAVNELFAPLGCGPGSSTLLYAAALERFERSDFQAVPGLEHPTRGWPVSYDAMRPYYECAERLYRVRGTNDPLDEMEKDFDLDRSSPLTMEKKCAFAWRIVQRAGILLTTPAVYRVSPSSWRACFCSGVGRVTISKGATDLSAGWIRFLTMVARSWSRS